MKHTTDGFSTALRLAKEYGLFADQDHKNRTSTFYFSRPQETCIFNHATKEIVIIKQGGNHG